MSTLEESVEEVIALLVRGEWEELERATSGQNLSAREIEEAIQQYGRTLIMPPPEEFRDQLDVVEIIVTRDSEFSVTTHLWTLEEGESDLSIELTVTEMRESESFKVEIDNIRVL
jgi:hypothetical protein